MEPEPYFIIKIVFPVMKIPGLFPLYSLYNWNSYTGNMVSLSWNSPLAVTKLWVWICDIPMFSSVSIAHNIVKYFYSLTAPLYATSCL